jgi:hypothetical protein
MKFKSGLKANLPTTALVGEPLVTTDTQEMYIGTETGLKKISDIIVSTTEPAVIDRFKLWLDPTTSVIKAFVNGVWEVVENAQGTDFGTF